MNVPTLRHESICVLYVSGTEHNRALTFAHLVQGETGPNTNPRMEEDWTEDHLSPRSTEMIPEMLTVHNYCRFEDRHVPSQEEKHFGYIPPSRPYKRYF